MLQKLRLAFVSFARKDEADVLISVYGDVGARDV
jgi:hypothetical protein